MILLFLAAMTPAQAATQPVADKKVAGPKTEATFYQLMDEVLEEIVRDISKLPAEDISPMAIGAVHVSANLNTQLEETLVLRMSAMLGSVKSLKQAHCQSCFSVRSRIEGGDWIVSRGIVGREDMKRVATEIGAKTFLSLGLEYVDGDYDYIAVNVRIIRAKDSAVVYAKRLLSNETEIALDRMGKRRLTDDERRAELEEMLEGKPRYGHQLMAAWQIMGLQFRDGNMGGIGYRLFESFGPKRSLQYGLQLEGMFGPAGVNLNILGVFNYVLRPQNQMVPRFRFGVDAGAVVFIPSATVGIGAFVEMVTHLGLGLRVSFRGLIPSGDIGVFQFGLGGVWAWE